MSGIYRIRNIVNGKVYIGCTVRDFIHRERHHFYKLRKGTHDNSHLQCSFNKYGEESFVFEVIEECGEELLDELERKYYFEVPEKLRYNCKIPNYNRYGGKLTQKTKDKIQKAMKENPPFKGKKHTEETKKIMSKLKEGDKAPCYGKFGEDHPSYGSKRTKEWKDKRSKRYSGEGNPNFGKFGKDNKLSKPVKQIDKITGEIIKVWESVAQASIELTGTKTTAPNITRCANKHPKYKTCKGFVWEYIED